MPLKLLCYSYLIAPGVSKPRAHARTWQDGHRDADRAAVTHKLKEQVNVIEQLRDDQLAARVNLGEQDLEAKFRSYIGTEQSIQPLWGTNN